MNLIGLPEEEIKAFLTEATLAAKETRATIARVNTMLDRFEQASTSFAAGWQVPPPKAKP